MRRAYIIAVSCCAAGVAFDQVSKTMIHEKLSPVRHIAIIDGYLELHFAKNTGMAFGLLPALVMRRLEKVADREAAKTVGVETYSAALNALFDLSEHADKRGDLYHPPLEKRLLSLQNS